MIAPPDNWPYRDLLERQRADVSNASLASARRLRWSADRLAAERERRLREVLAWSIERSAFHRERLKGLDTERFTEADLPSLPCMTKTEMMDNFDQLVTDPLLTLDRVDSYLDRLQGDGYLLDQYRVITSSGTTGLRAAFVFGWDDWCNFAAIATRWGGAEHADLPAGTRVGSLFASDPRHVSGALHAFFSNFSGDGGENLAHLPASLPVSQIVAGLNAAQPGKIRGYPSAVHLLALEAKAGRLRINPLVVSTCGEQCTEAVRSAVREAWGVEIYDYWGCSEGVYAFPCEAGRAMHLPDDMVIIEPVDSHGNVLPPGQPAAKILLTNLYNRAQPMLRYEIQDSMTVLSEPCACGCAHRRVDDLTGRTESFFVYEDAIAVHYLGMENMLFGCKAVAEFQVSQTPRGLHVALVTRGLVDFDELRLSLVTLLEKSGLRNPQVTIAETPSLERTWSGKLKQFQPLG
jgi:phenylacetate-coenzyme A ligase PaaK-like adenylate-forming protein